MEIENFDEQEFKHKLTFIRTMAIASSITSLSLLIPNYHDGKFFLVAVNIIFPITITSIVFFYLKKIKERFLIALRSSILATTIILFLMCIGEKSILSGKIQWFMLYPLFTITIFENRKEGIFWSFMGGIILTTTLLWSKDNSAYESNYIIRSIMAFVLIMIFAYYYRLFRDRLFNTIKILLNKSNNERNKYENLLRVLSHDVANPLTVIGAVSDKLIKQDASNVNYQRVDRAWKIIFEILEHTKEMCAMEDGKVEIKLSPIEPKNIFEQILFIFSTKLKEKNIELIIENQLKDDCKFLAEEKSFNNQVMNNLVSNAIKFSNSNSRIIIRAYEETNTNKNDNKNDNNNDNNYDNSYIVIEVVDFGIGIPKNLIDNLFNYKAKTSRNGTSGEKGTGFGMPLVKTYVEFYGGKLNIKSKTEIESGTTVSIHLKKINDQ
ncbi:MAG: HAMP domain-containing histidine kinase [Oligoflexia bacterium]|nr:HAMP domain-containing histidine kinase [Oligoflexia bacterium]